MRRALLSAGWALLALAAGCDDDPIAPLDLGIDAAPDADPDAAPDARPDAIPGPIEDAAPDARPVDAASDATPDAAPDAIADATSDGAPDTGDPGDAGPDGAPDALPPDMPWAPAVHRVFMTAEAFTADFGGLAGADAACAAAAAAAGLDGVWMAILSDADTGARDRLTITGPIETTAGARVAEGADDLWDGAIRSPIAVDATGRPPGGRPDVWTGTDADGSPDARANSFCSGWGRLDRPLGGVEIGRGDLVDARWIAFYRDGASAYACSSAARLYCIDGQSPLSASARRRRP